MVSVNTNKPLSKILGEMAVIAAVQTTSLGMTKLERQASTESDKAHGARIGAAKLNVSRMPGCEGPVDNIKKHHRQARDLLIGYTTQWGADRRLLPNVYIGDFSGEFEDIRKAHDAEAKAFVSKAKDYIKQAQANLGSYQVAPPTEDEIAGAFSLSFELTPVPDVTAYQIGDRELQKQLKERFEEDVKSQFQEAQRDLLTRLAKPLENLVDRMSKFDEREELKAKDITVGKHGTFKSTVITNITDIAKIFDSFNMTNDPVLTAIGQKLAAFDGIEHDDLTTSKDLRADTAKRAKEIRGLLGDWIS